MLALSAATDRGELGPAESDASSGRTYLSRPDLSAPLLLTTEYDAAKPARSAADDDLVFIAPKEGDPLTGPLIVDASGEPVWIHPLDPERAFDLRVQEYAGEPVLTWWHGVDIGVGYGYGEYTIMDQSYRLIATVRTQGSYADHHGMTLTDDGAALLITYRKERQDLSALGGPEDGWVVDQVVQEVDVATGAVVFEWSALDHIPVDQTVVRIRHNDAMDGSYAKPLDYTHVNSVTEDFDGSLLISGRNTSAVYRVDRVTGAVDWTLGGEASDFRMAGNSEFAWQHDAHRQPDGTLTLFDNEAAPQVGEESRGLRLALDMRSMTARVVTEYLPPDGRVSTSQGNMQVRANGNVFIGWGGLPYYSEYTADGDLLLDAEIISGSSYRAYRLPWVGRPLDPPDLVVEDGTAYVSWNGATEVASWRVLAGADAEQAREVVTAPRSAFETAIDVPDEPYLAVQALDDRGRVLATVED
jgi:arylsulfotransferase ASST